MLFLVPSSRFSAKSPARAGLRTGNGKPKTGNTRNSSGYILITLMLFLALFAMAALAVLPDLVQQIKRDREEEMLHRGTEYRRAVKKYFRKLGRYPARVEDLESTNRTRFLRKRYKDPLVAGNKDYKFVRVGDPLLTTLGMGMIGMGPGGGMGQVPGLGQPLNGPGINPGTGQTGNAPRMVGAQGGGVRPAGPDDADTPQVTGLPGQENAVTTNAPGGDAGNAGAADAKSSSDSADQGNNVLGGGAILGVASTSKAKSIREFNKKNHYNEWLFVYDQNSDRGGLLQGPLQTGGTAGIPGATMPGAMPGQSGKPAPAQSGAPAPGQPEPPDEQ
jgi:type II secretory pathway pseudopilin PulG